VRALLIGLGILGVLGAVLAFLPASLVASRLPPSVGLDGPSGTIWSGRGEHLLINGADVGALEWDVAPSALLGGVVQAAIQLKHPSGELHGTVRVGLGGRVVGDGIDLELPLTTLHPNHGPDAWTGVLAGHIEHVELERGWPVALRATFTINGLNAPQAPRPLGNFLLSFDGKADPGTSDLVGLLRDLDAPIEVRANLRLAANRTYRIAGSLAPRATLDPETTQALAFLGAADANGRREFEITGTF
jgi:hypothetical protein